MVVAMFILKIMDSWEDESCNIILPLLNYVHFVKKKNNKTILILIHMYLTFATLGLCKIKCLTF